MSTATAPRENQSSPSRASGGACRQDDCSQMNISEAERTLSSAAGVAMLAAGLLARRPLRMFAALAGAAMLYRGISGNCQLYRALDIDTSDQ